MKFGARYEILRALTRGDVETFEIRDRTSGEKALAHIFECPEPPIDQPTVQWILTSFHRIAPASPSEPIDVGRYDVASSAYIVGRWPGEEAIDSWVREYHNLGSPTPMAASSDPAAGHGPGKQPSAADGFPAAQPAAGTDPFLAGSQSGFAESPSSEFTRQFFGGVHFAGQAGSGKEAKPAEELESAGAQTMGAAKDGSRFPSGLNDEVSAPPLSEVPAQPPPGPGAFTQQFFREVNLSPDGPPAPSTDISGVREHQKVDSASPPTGSFTQQFLREINLSPDGIPGPSTNVSAFREHGEPEGESARQPGSPPAPWDEPPLSSDTGFDIQGKPAAPDSSSGQFTKLFMQDSRPAPSPPQPNEPPSREPAKSATGEFTRMFRMPSATQDSTSGIDPAFTSEPRGSTGEFTRAFGSPLPDGLEEARSQSFRGEQDPMSPGGSSTEILNGSSISDRRSGEDSYGTGTSASFGNVDDGGSTQAFARREYPNDYDRTPPQSPSTGPIPSGEQGIPDLNRFAGDGSATVVFRPTAEPAAEPQGELATGPSEWTIFRQRDELLAAAAASSPDPPAAPQGAGAGAGGAAFTPPVVAAPVIPSYQPPAPPVPAYPAVPGVAAPAVPSVAAPVIAAPSLAAPGGQPAPSPKSYWPLFIIMNVLFVLAVLLILYFAVKH
jgi:hypothetical protein